MSDRNLSIPMRRNRIRVLIVDDDPVLCTLLERYLSRGKDFEVVGTALNGQEGIKLCGGLQPQVVVMDYMMPDMDGITATRTIRNQYPQIQVLILSAAYDDQLVQRGIQAGAHDYLSKGALLRGLADSIRAAHSPSASPPLQSQNYSF